MDPVEQFKVGQRRAWATFAPVETFTCVGAPRLVRFAGIGRASKVLDVGCGTGVVALTAARTGANVSGLDLTPELIEHAKENAAVAGAEIAWSVGDIEAMPFESGMFDVVVSQFGHMFAPRPEVAVREMLRVLKPGGTIAFSTWPPELYTGRLFGLLGRYAPGLPPGIAPPPQWGDPTVIRERLGSAVKDIAFDRDVLKLAALSARHVRAYMERNVGPVTKLVESLSADPTKLAAFRAEFDALIALYFEDNTMRQDYLLTRAVKV